MRLGSATRSSNPPAYWLREGTVTELMLAGWKWPLEFFSVRYSGCIPVANMGTVGWGKGEVRAGNRNTCRDSTTGL